MCAMRTLWPRLQGVGGQGGKAPSRISALAPYSRAKRGDFFALKNPAYAICAHGARFVLVDYLLCRFISSICSILARNSGEKSKASDFFVLRGLRGDLLARIAFA